MIHAVSGYGAAGASSRVRLLDWFSHLGLAPTVHSYAGFSDNRPRRVARHPFTVATAEWRIRRLQVAQSTVVLSREATPFSHGEVEERLLREASWGVFDFDDALFVDGGGLRSLYQPAVKCARSVSAADVVIAGNEHLANWASQHSDRVQIIPSCVDPASYQAKTSWAVSDRPTIVWLGSSSTEHYVAEIAGPLRQVCDRTGARVMLISGRVANPALEVLGPSITRVPWSLSTVAAALASADVAIAPLNDSPYARGKCAYKLLQYAATGLPTVGAPIGANATALSSFDGLAAASHDEWVDALTQVLEESESRRAVRGRAAMRAVREKYSFDAWAQAWCAATRVTACQARVSP